MPKVVINKGWSGISLSAKAIKMLVDIDSELLKKNNKITFWGKEKDGSPYLPDAYTLNDFLDGCVLYEGGLYQESWQVFVLNGVWYEVELDSNRSHPDLIWLVETLRSSAVRSDSLCPYGADARFYYSAFPFGCLLKWAGGGER